MAEKGVKSVLTYRETLDIVAKQRYDDKISLINDRDPYIISKNEWSKDVEKWAGVTYPDIVNFLLYTTSAYTLDQLKSFKGLEAYNQFVSGWVREVAVCKINDLLVHSAKVMHSQRLSETPLSPWLIAEKDGKVLAAHCNCMAGLGESCTHIAALLFSIEATIKVRESRSVTDSKSYWLPTSIKGVDYARIDKIDFTSAKMKKKKLDMQFSDCGSSLTKRKSVPLKNVEPPTNSDIEDFLRKLSMTGTKAAILAVKEPFNTQFIPKALDPKFPGILSDLMNSDLLRASYGDIITYCENIEITVSTEEAESVERATKEQSKSKLWNRFRTGRITASRMHAVCHSSPAAPSESLIRAICNPEATKFVTPATTWGCEHEKEAREAYMESMCAIHENFTIEDAGFTINPEFPVFGASPDGLVSCDCCGQGLLEIKCPYCVRMSTLDVYVGPKSCLEETSTGTVLKTMHPYYFQVQTQLHICQKDYCDFVVWTEKDLHVERVEPNTDFWQENSAKASNFHSMAIMPELVAKFFSRRNMPFNELKEPAKQPDSNVFCYCRQGETDTMVACDNQNCPYQWFHLSCLKLAESQLPKGKWYCPDCRQISEFRPKKSRKK